MNYLLALLFGYCQLLWLPVIASMQQSALLLLGASLLCFRFRHAALVKIVFCVLMGYLCGQLIAQCWMQHSQRILSAGSEINITASIKNYSRSSAGTVRFEVEQLRLEQQRILGVVRLSWREPSQLPLPGEQWQLRVRLKPPLGLGNPDSFDYSRYLLGRQIIATGYVVAGKPLSASQGWRAEREKLLAKLSPDLQQTQHAALLKALSTGERGDIAQSIWQLLQETGTVHLMAISGLHVGAVFITLLWGLNLLARLRLLSESTAIIEPQRILLCLALSGALLFTLLAGATIPTLRAMVMLSAYTLYRLLQLHASRWHLLTLAMLLVLLLDPLAIFSNSFWLSICAVVVIFIALELAELLQLQPWQQSLFMPFAIFLGMLPMQLMLFGQSYWIAPFANLLAIPWVSWLVLPLCLLGVLLSSFSLPYAETIWRLADQSLELLLTLLSEMAQWQLGGPDNLHMLYLAACVLFLLLLAYLLRQLRWFILGLCCLPLLAGWWSLQRKPPEFSVVLLDVGQGLSVLIRQGERVLIYDVGAAYPSGFNMADTVLLPYLKVNQLTQLDWLILSHSDNDHAGAARYLLQQVEVDQLAASYPFAADNTIRCQAGQQFQWGAVSLKFLAPNGEFKGDNNNSCVLLLEYQQQRILLTGDIDWRVERWLTEQYPAENIDILLAAHHGSRSSSSLPFIHWAKPEMVLVSAGAWNRWQFPRSQVVERFRAAGSQFYSTHCLGQLVLRLDDTNWSVDSFRGRALAPWYHKFSAPPCK